MNESTTLGDSEAKVQLKLATLPGADGSPLCFTPERIFGHHCAIVGTTGSGKSWTVARLVEELARYACKVILFDASGEFYRLRNGVRHVHLGFDPDPKPYSAEAVLPYYHLTEADLFAIFKPNEDVQAPKLRAAMRSLKLAKLNTQLAPDGTILKANKSKVQYQESYRRFIDTVESPLMDFDVNLLSRQIQNECINPVRSAVEPLYWGADNAAELGACFSLMNRIDDILKSKSLGTIFQPNERASLFDEIDEFLNDRTSGVLRVSLEYLPYAHNSREIIANAAGRHLLELARAGRFEQCPLLVILEEAHHFLNFRLSDVHSFSLDSFGTIAKEGRKYSLNICLATQRPRDIPESVLSQMGTMIVHRLINDFDRGVIERASGELNNATANALPALLPGEAVLVGVGFKEPLQVRMLPAAQKPDSQGPDFQRFWGI